MLPAESKKDLFTDVELTNSVCNNIDGSFECLCKDGFEKDATGACVNVDECGDGTDTCFDATADGFMSEICTNAEIFVAGDLKFTCACPEHSTMVTDGCQDNNDCDNVCNSVDPIEVCVNKHFIDDDVTHTCKCVTGFKSLMHPLIQQSLMAANELTMMNANLTHALEMVLDANTTPDHMNVAVISQELN